MRLYRNFLLISAIAASVSHAGWNGGYGSVAGITASAGRVTQILLADNAKLIWDSAASIGDDGSDNLDITAAASKSVKIKEAAGDGGNVRINSVSNGSLSFLNGTGTIIASVASGGSSFAIASGQVLDLAAGAILGVDYANTSDGLEAFNSVSTNGVLYGHTNGTRFTDWYIDTANRRSAAREMWASIGFGNGASAANFPYGATVASGQTLTASKLKGHNGSTLVIEAGDTAGDDVVIAEGSGDGSTNRVIVYGGGGLTLGGADAAIAATVGASGGLTANGGLEVTGGFLGLGTPTELTIASGSVTPTQSFHLIDTEGDAATDDVDTFATTNASQGDKVCMYQVDPARDVTYKHATGNILMKGAADLTPGSGQRIHCWVWDGSTWWRQLADE